MEDLSATVERKEKVILPPTWQAGSWYESCHGKPAKSEWESMMGKSYVESKLRKGQFTMDNTVEEMKEFSLVMKIMYTAVETTIAKGFGGKKDYENPDFWRWQMDISFEELGK